jgi:RNA-directed DNA polymerase
MNKDKTEYKDWRSIPWKQVEKTVFKLQKRIYRAKVNGDQKLVRKLQRLLINSRSAKALAIRKVTQDNRGKKTPGVDGKKALTPKERMGLLNDIRINGEAKPLRRIYIPKKSGEQRPLSIPTISDRAKQMLVKMALEPEWEAIFEPNSYGFRPGRSPHDAMKAIFNAVHWKPKWVLDADIEKCFDKINHQYLLRKLGGTLTTVRKQIKMWLKAGFMDGKKLFPTEEGTPQGGVVSPLLANIALHGLENELIEWVKTWYCGKGVCKRDHLAAFSFIRYADDFVCIHNSKERVEEAKEIITKFLENIGLKLKENKTKIVHVTEGFNFLGFNIRQHQVGKHHSGKLNGKLLGHKTIIKPSKEAIAKHMENLKEVVAKHKAAPQEALIGKLNPKIKGWGNYYRAVVSAEIFSSLDYHLNHKLRRWVKRRHPRKNAKWWYNKYWMNKGNKRWVFGNENATIAFHSDIKIQRHKKIQDTRSPYDGDTVYWGKRLSSYIGLATNERTLLKKQKGKCNLCHMEFKHGDLWEVDHIVPKCKGGKDSYDNLQLLHAHCHDTKTRYDGSQNKGTHRAK